MPPGQIQIEPVMSEAYTQEELHRHPNRGLDYERTKWNPREKALAETWEKENNMNPGINHGCGILQDLMYSTTPHSFPTRRHTLTKNERMIAATAIQWLGSNCGMDFLERCLNKAGYRLMRDPTVQDVDIRETVEDGPELERVFYAPMLLPSGDEEGEPPF